MFSFLTPTFSDLIADPIRCPAAAAEEEEEEEEEEDDEEEEFDDDDAGTSPSSSLLVRSIQLFIIFLEVKMGVFTVNIKRCLILCVFSSERLQIVQKEWN